MSETATATPASVTTPEAGVSALHWVGTICRVLVGAQFLYLGALKLSDLPAFGKVMVEYDLFPLDPPHLVNFMNIWIPHLEIVLGLMLIPGLRTRAASLITFGMLVVFTFAVTDRAFELVAASDGAETLTTIAFDCGCGNGPQVFWTKALENCLLIAGSAIAFLYGARALAFDGRRKSGPEKDLGPAS